MQQITTRPWIAAGVALVGAGAIAATPAVASAPALSELSSHAVQLTSGFDPFTAWQDVFTTAGSNVSSLWDNASAAPFVAGQQLIYDLVDGKSIDPKAIFDAIAQPATDPNATVPETALSNDTLHILVSALLPSQLPSSIPADLAAPVVSFLASPLSGVLIGELGPSISPWVALLNSMGEISTALSGSSPDMTAALQDLVNIPADMVGGYLNGATLNLDGLLPSLTSAGLLPAAMDITALSYTFGGLLSPGETATTVANMLAGHAGGTATDPTLYDGIGGSILNGLGLDVNSMGLNIPGEGVGPLGAMESLSEIVANALGWDGTGNPLEDLASSL